MFGLIDLIDLLIYAYSLSNTRHRVKHVFSGWAKFVPSLPIVCDIHEQDLKAQPSVKRPGWQSAPPSSLPGNGDVPPDGWGLIAVSLSEGVQVSRGHVHQWRETGARDGKAVWCGISNIASIGPDHGDEEGACVLRVHLCSDPYL